MEKPVRVAVDPMFQVRLKKNKLESLCSNLFLLLDGEKVDARIRAY